MNNDTPSDTESDIEPPRRPDQRVFEALEQMGVTHDIDEDTGNFLVLVEFKDGRTQQVFIRSATTEFMGVEMRTISSVALINQGPFDTRTANFLLRDNANVSFGSWQVEVDQERTHYAIFSMTVSASLRAESLVDLLGMVARIADTTEERLSGLDEF